MDAAEQGVDGYLLQNKPAITTIIVNNVRIPLSKVIVGSTVNRMIKIVRTRINS